jgi:hypothetical protein
MKVVCVGVFARLVLKEEGAVVKLASSSPTWSRVCKLQYRFGTCLSQFASGHSHLFCIDIFEVTVWESLRVGPISPMCRDHNLFVR